MRTFVMLLLGLSSFSLFAEGRCPPGQYPIGGQGAGGCAPIGGGAVQNAVSVPTGRWHKTWGAVASSKSGDAGAVEGRMSKAEAAAGAVEKCAQWGATDCKTVLTYKNQCAAVVQADKAIGTRLNTGESEQVAVERATESCRKTGSATCTKIYSACSKPYFEEF